MPFFSVVIPLYNKERFIENTLRSVLAQTFGDFEILVIDNGSTDGSAEKAKTIIDSRVRYFSKPNDGVSAARNFGIDHAASDFISFLDADDYWYPEFLQTMRDNIAQFPDQSVFAAAIEIETPKTVIPAVYSIEKKETQVVNYFAASQKETIICTSCAAFHKSVFESAGVFDTTMSNSEDIDLWMRMGLEFPVVFSNKILARYVYDPRSLSRNQNTRVDFSKFSEAEKTNPVLKKFLDLNRFSLAVKSKLNGDYDSFLKFYSAIDQNNLSPKKKMVLTLPPFALRIAIGLREQLVRYGLASSVFK
ncbi:MAG: glycosyl transferase [Flavobacterium sp. BFFFF1]|uniref:glycosyltransferase family 2 protein n=1 Tax=Flavobacterium sp. BFFFF1 TaxID=2015557 RepID=UPI000BCED06C|nr:glycosyltransferase [Flavobacterium sp. BFFFF1]OYU80154.1 MAG: glycosyl transferase [Flavobacterium sp. BFFFF1]